jgi:hypothetical protein
MPDMEKVIKGLEHCSEDGCKGCPYEQDCKMCDGFSDLAKDALELLKEWENEIQIASTQGFYEGYNQAMSEMPEEIKHMTNKERFDMQIIREIREGNGNVRHIRTGSYVIMRRDIYDRYREKVGELGCG